MAGASDAALNIVLSARDEMGPGVASAEGKLAKLKGIVATTSAIWAAGGMAAMAAVGFLSDAAKAAADDAASTDRLSKAVENSGASWKDSQGAIEARIKMGQDLAFSDDQTRDSLSLLVAQTGSVDEAMKRNALAMDLARGAHIDVVSASKLLGKVTDDNVGVLAKYGIQVDKGSDQAALFAAVQKKFGGQAKVYGDSQAGMIDRIKDKFSEWKESIGGALGPMAPFIALLPGLSAGFSAVGMMAGPAAAGIKAIGESSQWTAIKAGVVRGATLAWTAAQWLLNVALSANPIGLVVLGIAALALGFYLAYQKITPFREAVDKAWGAIKQFAAGVWSHVQPALQWLWDMLQKVGGLINAVFTLNLGGIASSLHNLHIPGFAMGGIVVGKAAGAATMILAHGGEAIVGKDGGSVTVPGPRGAAQLMLAHAGDTVLTIGENRRRESAIKGFAWGGVVGDLVGFSVKDSPWTSGPREDVRDGARSSTVNVDVRIGNYVGDASKLSKLLAHELRLAGAI
jgi:hypothetical protein